MNLTQTSAQEMINALRALKVGASDVFYDAPYLCSSRSTHYEYIFQGTTVCLVVCGMDLVLQNGNHYHNNDYSLPSNKLYPSDEGGCNDFFVQLSALTEEDIKGLDDEDFEEWMERGFTTRDELAAVLVALDAALDELNDKFRPKLNVEDFEERVCEMTGERTLVEKKVAIKWIFSTSK